MKTSAQDAYRKVKNKYIEQIYTDFSMRTPATEEWLDAIISNFILKNLNIDDRRTFLDMLEKNKQEDEITNYLLHKIPDFDQKLEKRIKDEIANFTNVI